MTFLRYPPPRLALAALVCGVTLIAGCGNDEPAAAPIPEAAFTLQLLHLSDMDGSDATALKSVASMSALLKQYRAQFPSSTVVLSSGDNYIPGPRLNAAIDPSLSTPDLLGKAEVGRADIAFVNELGVVASALGNHELDLGTRQFRDMIIPDGAWTGAAFPYLAYNVDFSADASLAPLVAPNGQDVGTLSNKVSGWATVTVDGQMIGLIGASSPIFTTITSTGDLAIAPALVGSGVDVPALATQIQRGVDEITAAGIDKIILLAHMQSISIERQLAALLRDVDIIVAGGSNTLLADANDTLRTTDTAADTYPLSLQSASQQPVLVVNTDADYKYLGRLVAPFDANGVLIPARLDDTLNGAIATTENATTAGTETAAPRIVAIRDAINDVLVAKDAAVFGKSEVFLEGRRALVRNEETNLGNLSADANQWYAGQAGFPADVSLKNGGGIRAEIGVVFAPPGAVSAAEAQLLPPQASADTGRGVNEISQLAIETSLKFNNQLWVLDVTAQQLKDLLEHGVASLGSQGRFPQVGGMRLSYDPAGTAQQMTGASITTPGTRIRSLLVGSDIVVSAGAIVGDPNRVFRLVTLGFLAQVGTSGVGGDGYPFPASPTNLVKLEEQGLAAGSATFASPGSEQDALAEYLLSQYAVTAFAQAETPATGDQRIQNLAVRADTVLSP